MKIIIFLVLSTLSYTSKRTASDLKCLKKNKFQDTAASTKTITTHLSALPSLLNAATSI